MKYFDKIKFCPNFVPQVRTILILNKKTNKLWVRIIY